MIVNLIVIMIVVSLGYIFSKILYPIKDSFNVRKLYIQIISLILILQSGLRNVAVGTDTYGYFGMYEDVKLTSWNEIYNQFVIHYALGIGKDPGYSVFEKIAQLFLPQYQLFLFLIAILFFIALGNFILKNTTQLRDAVLSYVLYSVLFYSFFSITGHRQTIATAAVFYSFELMKKNKFIYSTVLILVASTIHQSCLIFLPFYFISKLKSPKNLLVLVLILFPILFVISSKISSIFIGLSQNYEEYGHMEEYKPITFTLLMLLIVSVALIRYNKVVRIFPAAIMQYSAMILMTFFLSLVFEIHIFMRIVQYFSIFILALVPLTFQSFDIYTRKLQNLFYGVVVLLLIAMSIKANINMEYKFFWQDMKLEDVYL